MTCKPYLEQPVSNHFSPVMPRSCKQARDCLGWSPWLWGLGWGAEGQSWGVENASKDPWTTRLWGGDHPRSHLPGSAHPSGLLPPSLCFCKAGSGKGVGKHPKTLIPITPPPTPRLGAGGSLLAWIPRLGAPCPRRSPRPALHPPQHPSPDQQPLTWGPGAGSGPAMAGRAGPVAAPPPRPPRSLPVRPCRLLPALPALSVSSALRVTPPSCRGWGGDGQLRRTHSQPRQPPAAESPSRPQEPTPRSSIPREMYCRTPVSCCGGTRGLCVSPPPP